jgi:hypothetical protein
MRRSEVKALAGTVSHTLEFKILFFYRLSDGLWQNA